MYEDYGLDSILEASKMRFNESQELKQAGSADWWRVSFQFIDLNSTVQFLAYHIHQCCLNSYIFIAISYYIYILNTLLIT